MNHKIFIRYLVPFHPKSVPHFFTDVLIIGSGLAGLRAALAVDHRSVGGHYHQGRHRCNPTAAWPREALPACSIREDSFEDHIARHAPGRRLAVRSAGGGASNSPVPAADPGIDRLGRKIRHPRRPLVLGPRRRPQPRPHRPRPGRRHGQGNNARGDRPRTSTAQRENLGKHLHHRPIDPRGRLPRGAGLEQPPRQDHGLGEADHTGQRRGGPTLSRNHQSRGGHRRRHGHGLSRRRGTARHGVHAVSSHCVVHRRRQPAPDLRGHAGSGRLAGRPPRPPLYGRLRSARRACPARRGQPGHRLPDGKNQAPARLSRPHASRSCLGPQPLSGHRRSVRGIRSGYHPPAQFQSGRARIT